MPVSAKLSKNSRHYIPSNTAEVKPARKSSLPLRKAPVNELNESRVYSLSEVNHHDHPDDLWMVIYNKVYDVTLFAVQHPGGAEVLFDCGGVDATEAFEDVAHSNDALDMLKPFYIGELAKEERVRYKKPVDITTNIKATETKKLKNRQMKLMSDKKKVLDQLVCFFFIILATAALALYVYLQKFRWASHIDT